MIIIRICRNKEFFSLNMNGGPAVAEQNEKMIRTTVDIYGQQYTVVGEEDSSHVRMVASMVDDKMREINHHNPYLDTNKLAVLTAVNTMNEFLKLKKEYDVIKEKLRKEEGKTSDG